MATQHRDICIRLDDNELVLLLTLLDSTIGGPVWRRNEREGWTLLARIEDHAEGRSTADRRARGVAHGDAHESPA